MIPEGGIKSFFDKALKKVIGEDLTYKVGRGGFLFKNEEPRGTYKRTARENFVNSIFNTPNDSIEVPAPNKKEGTITVDIDEAQGSIDVPDDTSKNPLDTPETPTFDRNRVVAVLNAPEWNDGSRTNEEKAAFWNGLIAQFPESADEIGQLAEESAGGKKETPPPSPTPAPTPSPTPAPKDSLLSPNIPTQAELVKDFEILGAEKMSSEEIDTRLNEMINQKDDFTTDEYIKLITYLNAKKGIRPSSQTIVNKKPSILAMDSDKDIMNSEAAIKAREEAAQIPGQVVEGVKNFGNRNRINNLEKDLERVKDNKRPIMTLNSSMRDYLEENYNVTSLRTLSKSKQIKAIEELINLLKS